MIDYLEWFPKRISQLRTLKGVSARDMSLSLGQSESYINKIENRRTMPSMQGFFYICDYFGITPSEFFDENILAPQESKQLLQKLGKLSAAQLAHILLIIDDLLQR